MANEERTILLKVELDVGQLRKNAADAEKRLKVLVPALADIKKEQGATSVAFKTAQAEVKRYTKELTDTTKAIEINTNVTKKATATNKEQGATIKDAKAELLAAKIAYSSLTEEERKNSDAGKTLATDIRKISVALKNEEGALKSMAGALNSAATGSGTVEERLKKLNAVIKEAPINVRDMNKQIQAYQTIALEAGRTSPVGKQALAQAAQLTDKYKDIQNETKRLADDQKNLKGVLEIGKGVVAGYGALQGAMALAGGQSEEMRKVFIKLQAAQTILMSLDALRTTLQKESSAALLISTIRTNALTASQKLATIVTKEGTQANKNFAKALVATGIGAIIAAIGLLIANWDNLKSMLDNTTLSQKALNDTMEAYSTGATEAITKTTKVGNAFDQAKAGVISKEEALLIYNETLGDSFGRMDDIDKAEKNFSDKTGAYIEASAKRAQANELIARTAKLQAEVLTSSIDDQTSFFQDWLNSFGESTSLAAGDLEEFHKKQAANQDEARKNNNKNREEEVAALKELTRELLDSVEATEDANGLKSDSDKALADQRKKFSDEQKKRDDDALKLAIETAKKTKEIQIGNLELSLSNERAALEAHYEFLETIAKGNAAQIKKITEDKNSEIADIELKELEQSKSRLTEKYDEEAKQAEEGSDLLVSLTNERNLSLEALDLEFNNRVAQRGAERIAEETKVNDEIVEVNRDAANQIALIEKELALEIAKGTKGEAKAWQDLQDERIRQIEVATQDQVNNEALQASQRVAIEKQAELDIQAIRNETFAQTTAHNEALKQQRKDAAASILNTANQLGQSLFQIGQNQLQTDLNNSIEKHEAETENLQNQLNAGIISQAQFDAQKSALDAAAASKEAKIKEQQFKADRNASLIQAAINTAVGVTAASPVIPLMIAAAALGALQIALIASQPTPKFAKGAAMSNKEGTFKGASHAGGGIELSANGTPIGEVEGNENFYIVNKKSSDFINGLSNLNVSGGGVPLAKQGGVMKFQAGGAFSSAISQPAQDRFSQRNLLQQAIESIPPGIVLVEDVNSAQANQLEIRTRADV